MQLTGTVRRKITMRVITAAMLAAVAGAGIYWFGPQHLFLDERLDEAAPTVAPGASIDGGRGTTPGETGGLAGGGGTNTGVPAGPTVLATGGFTSLEHVTTGTASIIELADGSRYLRLEDLDSLSGPDLRVYLSPAAASGPADAFDDAPIDLGGLKANQGDQNYLIPEGVDLDAIRSVSIWCRRFSVGFGVAPLA